MANYTESHVHEFIGSAIWQDILARIGRMLGEADAAIERPEPFEHGVAVGKRKILREMEKMPEELIRILKTGGSVSLR